MTAIIIISSYRCSWSYQLLLTLIPNEGSARLRWGWQVVKTSTTVPLIAPLTAPVTDTIASQSTHAGKGYLPSESPCMGRAFTLHASIGISAFVSSMFVISLIQYSLDNISMLPMESVLEQFLSIGIIIF